MTRWILLLIVLGGQGLLHAAPGPADAKPDMRATSPGGVRVEIFSQLSPIQINRLHSWQIRLSDADGKAIRNAEVTLVGGMPDHDHGLPTRPAVTGEIAPGVYLLQGMRLHMPGRWLISIDVDSDTLNETIELELQL